jgi:16S rRNA (cytosine967-C5)-methyltransferase
VIAPARSAAVRALAAVAGGSADLPAALHAARVPLADERDRALATDIVTGTIRWQRRLDHLIAATAGRPLDRIDPRLLLVLRMSVYQILFLDRVPASAVVDDAVDLARAAQRSRGAGFVNAVLRSLIRQRHRLPDAVPPPDEAGLDAVADGLGVRWSHPTWLVRRWLERYGRTHTEQWLAFNNERPATTLRVNRLRATRDEVIARLAHDGVEALPTPFAPDGLHVPGGLASAAQPDGLVTVQDEASQLVPLLVGAGPGDRVLDLCAAPGGKATAMALPLQESGLLVACDVRPRRIGLLRDTIRLSGLAHLSVCQVSGSGPLPFAPRFTRVLVDAPCSGLGTIRRDPDIRWRRTAADLPALAARQFDLLARAAAVVAPGGRLVYATCSSEPEENEEVVAAFLAAHPAFTLLDPRDELPAPVRPLIDAHGFLRTQPCVHGLEAFFAAAMTRRQPGP